MVEGCQAGWTYRQTGFTDCYPMRTNRDGFVLTGNVSTPEELARQAEAVARVRAARIQRDKTVKDSTKRLRTEIIRAVNTGASIKDVAKAAELTRQRVHQILNEPR